jgi:hypothetical protein
VVRTAGSSLPGVVAAERARYALPMQRAPTSWIVDPDDPRAPPQDIWDRMTAEERQRVVETLPSEFDVSEASPPEGDFHFEAKTARCAATSSALAAACT